MNKACALLEQINSANLGVSNKTFVIYDGGAYTSIAERLARDAGKVKYYVPYYNSDLKISRSYIGAGLENVEVITDFWKHLKDADSVIFPDCYNDDLMSSLLEDGINVLAPGKAAILETNKEISRKVLNEAGIKITNGKVVKGLSNLIKELEGSKGGRVVKPIEFRGEFETIVYTDMESAKSRLDETSLILGPFAEDFLFLVEDEIPDHIEGGTENIFFNGDYLSPCLFGFTSGYLYVGKSLEYKDIPKAFSEPLEKLKKILKGYGFNGFFSTEILNDKKNSYLSDMTMRNSNIHVSGIQTELITNFTDLVHGLATKQAVTPAITKKYAGSAVLVTSEKIESWATVKAPKEASEWLKLEYNAKHGEDYVLAPKGQVTCGAIIAVGDSIDQVIDLIQERFEQVECSIGFDPIPSREEYMKFIEKIRDFEIEF